MALDGIGFAFEMTSDIFIDYWTEWFIILYLQIHVQTTLQPTGRLGSHPVVEHSSLCFFLNRQVHLRMFQFPEWTGWTECCWGEKSTSFIDLFFPLRINKDWEWIMQCSFSSWLGEFGWCVGVSSQPSCRLMKTSILTKESVTAERQMGSPALMSFIAKRAVGPLHI